MINFLKALLAKRLKEKTKKLTLKENFADYCEKNPGAIECKIYEV